ncbi:UNVERIFIED_CONTAM: hypothetical protein FKN15_043522 [Acipenser sinensis]
MQSEVTVGEGLPTASEIDTFENVTVFDRLSSNGCCSIEIEYPEELSSAKARKNYKDRVLRESPETLIANYSTVDNCRVKCNLLLYTEHPSAWHSALCSTYCNIRKGGISRGRQLTVFEDSDADSVMLTVNVYHNGTVMVQGRESSLDLFEQSFPALRKRVERAKTIPELANPQPLPQPPAQPSSQPSHPQHSPVTDSPRQVSKSKALKECLSVLELEFTEFREHTEPGQPITAAQGRGAQAEDRAQGRGAGAESGDERTGGGQPGHEDRAAETERGADQDSTSQRAEEPAERAGGTERQQAPHTSSTAHQEQQSTCTACTDTHTTPATQADSQTAPNTHTTPATQADSQTAPNTHTTPATQADSQTAPNTHTTPATQADSQTAHNPSHTDRHTDSPKHTHNTSHTDRHTDSPKHTVGAAGQCGGAHPNRFERELITITVSVFVYSFPGLAQPILAVFVTIHHAKCDPPQPQELYTVQGVKLCRRHAKCEPPQPQERYTVQGDEEEEPLLPCPMPEGEEPECPQPKREEPERPTPEWEEPERPTPKWEEPKCPTPEWEEPERPTPEWEEPKCPTPEWEEPERPTPKWEEPKCPTPEWEEPERPTPKWEEPKCPTPEWEEPERPAVPIPTSRR